MYRQIDGLGAPSVTSVLDDAIVGDNNLDWVTPWSRERGRLDVSRLTSTKTGAHAGRGSFRPRDPDV
jgi:hypothetical protein